MIKDERVMKVAFELAHAMFPKTAASVGHQSSALWAELNDEDRFKIFTVGRRIFNIHEGREPGQGPN